jgi:hypothetical protein
MSGEAWTVNSDYKLTAYIEHVKKLYAEHKYLTFPAPRIGADRSLDQNALLHVWITEYVAEKLSINKREITPAHIESMKRAIKGKFYNETGEPWMIHELTNPFTGEKKKDFTSSRRWKRGEMFMFLTWMQAAAANDGVILESKGEFNKLQREAA